MGHNICTRLRSVSGRVYSVIHILVVRTGCPTVVLVFFVEEVVDGHTQSYFFHHLSGFECIGQMQVAHEILIQSQCFHFCICHILLADKLGLKGCFESLIGKSKTVVQQEIR